MYALKSEDGYNAAHIHAISPSIEKLIEFIPEGFVEAWDNVWVHLDDWDWFEDDEDESERQAQYYWVEETDIKVL